MCFVYGLLVVTLNSLFFNFFFCLFCFLCLLWLTLFSHRWHFLLLKQMSRMKILKVYVKKFIILLHVQPEGCWSLVYCCYWTDPGELNHAPLRTGMHGQVQQPGSICTCYLRLLFALNLRLKCSVLKICQWSSKSEKVKGLLNIGFHSRRWERHNFHSICQIRAFSCWKVRFCQGGW